MASNTLLRPGSRLGVYPQRREAAPGTFERMISVGVERLASLASLRRYRFKTVVARVNEAGADLDELTDEALRKRLEQARHALLRDGLTDPLVINAFALIREFAQRSLGLRYYDVQLFGAWVIVQGNMAEMATGEGKSLTATLSAGAAALAGIPVHVITTNEYLASRDAKAMRPLYDALGLSVAVVTEKMDANVKRQAYCADVVYCTNKQIAFDYLRDRLMLRNESGRLSLKFGDAYQSDQLVLRGLCFAILDEADSLLIDEARTPLILSKQHEDEGRQRIYEQALELANQLEEAKDFTLDLREQRISLSRRGVARLTELARPYAGVWTGARHREYLVHQALCALHLFVRDRHYLLRDDKVQIIDLNTGRVMADRSWQQGLHQLVELKEGVAISGQRETIASIAYQRFFRRYLRLGGMSGTLRPVRRELAAVYGQRVIAVPRHRPCLLSEGKCEMYGRAQDKWLAVFKQVEEIHKTGQPVLVGTCSLRDSELLAHLLRRRKLPFRVLNARQDAQEAEIIAHAGQRGQITLATNMAGRGTDIKLGAGVAELGGLHVICTECHEETRVDRQLYGRSARQGDPGSYQRILSLADNLVQNYYTTPVRRWLGRFTLSGRPLPGWLVRPLIWLPQWANSRRSRRVRRDVASQDEQLGKMLAYSGNRE